MDSPVPYRLHWVSVHAHRWPSRLYACAHGLYKACGPTTSLQPPPGANPLTKSPQRRCARERWIVSFPTSSLDVHRSACCAIRKSVPRHTHQPQQRASTC